MLKIKTQNLDVDFTMFPLSLCVHNGLYKQQLTLIRLYVSADKTEPRRGRPSQEPLPAAPLPARRQAYSSSKHRWDRTVLLLGRFQHLDPPSAKSGGEGSKAKSWSEHPRQPALRSPCRETEVAWLFCCACCPAQLTSLPLFTELFLCPRPELTPLLTHGIDWWTRATLRFDQDEIWRFDRDEIQGKNYQHSTWHNLSFLVCKMLDR